MRKGTLLTQCPVCRNRTIRLVKKDLTFQRGQRTYRIPSIEREVCQHCGEEFFDKQANQQIDAYLSRKRKAAA